MNGGKLWTVRDRYGNNIYLTQDRWAHIIDLDNHPEVEPFFDYIAATISRGRRRQDRYNSNGYQYYQSYPDLPDDNTYIVVCVRFRWTTVPNGTVREEKFVTTSYFQSF